MPSINLFHILWLCVAVMIAAVAQLYLSHRKTLRQLEESLRGRRGGGDLAPGNLAPGSAQGGAASGGVIGEPQSSRAVGALAGLDALAPGGAPREGASGVNAAAGLAALERGRDGYFGSGGAGSGGPSGFGGTTGAQGSGAGASSGAGRAASSDLFGDSALDADPDDTDTKPEVASWNGRRGDRANLFTPPEPRAEERSAPDRGTDPERIPDRMPRGMDGKLPKFSAADAGDVSLDSVFAEADQAASAGRREPTPVPRTSSGNFRRPVIGAPREPEAGVRALVAERKLVSGPVSRPTTPDDVRGLASLFGESESPSGVSMSDEPSKGSPGGRGFGAAPPAGAPHEPAAREAASTPPPDRPSTANASTANLSAAGVSTTNLPNMREWPSIPSMPVPAELSAQTLAAAAREVERPEAQRQRLEDAAQPPRSQGRAAPAAPVDDAWARLAALQVQPADGRGDDDAWSRLEALRDRANNDGASDAWSRLEALAGRPPASGDPRPRAAGTPAHGTPALGTPGASGSHAADAGHSYLERHTSRAPFSPDQSSPAAHQTGDDVPLPSGAMPEEQDLSKMPARSSRALARTESADDPWQRRLAEQLRDLDGPDDAFAMPGKPAGSGAPAAASAHAPAAAPSAPAAFTPAPSTAASSPAASSPAPSSPAPSSPAQSPRAPSAAPSATGWPAPAVASSPPAPAASTSGEPLLERFYAIAQSSATPHAGANAATPSASQEPGDVLRRVLDRARGVQPEPVVPPAPPPAAAAPSAPHASSSQLESPISRTLPPASRSPYGSSLPPPLSATPPPPVAPEPPSPVPSVPPLSDFEDEDEAAVPRPVARRASDFLAEGKFEEAATMLRARVAQRTATEDDFRMLGKALANLGRMDEAISVWERMLEVYPNAKGGLAALNELVAQSTPSPVRVLPPGKKLSFKKPLSFKLGPKKS